MAGGSQRWYKSRPPGRGWGRTTGTRTRSLRLGRTRRTPVRFKASPGNGAGGAKSFFLFVAHLQNKANRPDGFPDVKSERRLDQHLQRATRVGRKVDRPRPYTHGRRQAAIFKKTEKRNLRVDAGSFARVLHAVLNHRLDAVGPAPNQAARVRPEPIADAVEAKKIILADVQVNPAAPAARAGAEGQRVWVFGVALVDSLSRRRPGERCGRKRPCNNQHTGCRWEGGVWSYCRVAASGVTFQTASNAPTRASQGKGVS